MYIWTLILMKVRLIPAIIMALISSPIVAFDKAQPHYQFHENKPYLIDIRIGTGLSATAKSLGKTQFELMDGRIQTLREFYQLQMPSIGASIAYDLNDTSAVILGFDTGERGKKYTIDPAIRLGFYVSYNISTNTKIEAISHFIVGGNLREKACLGDYGDIGGIQSVNCRLAATPLPPEETLKFLSNVKGNVNNKTTVTLRHRF